MRRSGKTALIASAKDHEGLDDMGVPLTSARRSLGAIFKTAPFKQRYTELPRRCKGFLVAANQSNFMNTVIASSFLRVSAGISSC